jgi:lipopolysaccharide transport system permease protein
MAKLVIDPRERSVWLNGKELFAYRDLFVILAYRDLRVRYAQTFLGVLWAVIQPLCTLLIFTLVFGRAMRVDTADVPYPVFAMCGMSAWTYFAFVMNQAGNSIISAQGMIQKIYFPRLIIPLSKAVVGFVDFAISFVFALGLALWYGVPLSSNIVFLPVFILLTLITALGVGIWLSALTIRYRDFQHIVPFLVQIGLYATPIAYPTSLFTDRFQLLVHINPMAGIVEGFRWSILGAEAPHPYAYLSFTLALVLFLTGLLYFRKVERVMADIV